MPATAQDMLLAWRVCSPLSLDHSVLLLKRCVAQKVLLSHLRSFTRVFLEDGERTRKTYGRKRITVHTWASPIRVEKSHKLVLHSRALGGWEGELSWELKVLTWVWTGSHKQTQWFGHCRRTQPLPPSYLLTSCLTTQPLPPSYLLTSWLLASL